MRIPIGPLLNFEDGLNPRTGSAFSARLSSTSPKDFMFRCQLFDYFNESGDILCTQRFACTHGVPMYTPVNTTVGTYMVLREPINTLILFTRVFSITPREHKQITYSLL